VLHSARSWESSEDMMRGAQVDKNARVNGSAICVITRFQLRSVRGLLRCFWSFRRVRSQSTDVPGLITTLFAIESPRACYTISLWQDEASLLHFNTNVLEHVRAANACFRDLDRNSRGPLLWSARFQLSTLSACNSNWPRREKWLLQHALDRPAASSHE
jgi:hypothetical protein